jgi:phosphatidylglycerophosphate synthase
MQCSLVISSQSIASSSGFGFVREAQRVSVPRDEAQTVGDTGRDLMARERAGRDGRDGGSVTTSGAPCATGQVTLRGRHPTSVVASSSEQSMLPTLITLSRFPLLAIVVATLYRGSPAVRLIGVGVLLLGLLLDTVDGAIARRRNEATLVGSVLDIAADRTYELVLWMCFADLGLISVLIPLIVVARTALTDAFRSVGVGQGIAPFAQLGAGRAGFLVASSWMRTGYGVSKVLAFCGLALVPAFGRVPTQASGLAAWEVANALAWITVALCVVRGLPVIVQGLRQHRGTSGHASTA